MNEIRKSIQAAIERMGAATMEERNKIYLAARDAIQKLPEEKSATAMDQLLEAVKQIETEFAQAELAHAEKDRVAPPSSPETAPSTAAIPDTASLPDDILSPETPGIQNEASAFPDESQPSFLSRFPFRLVLIVLALLVAMAMSGYLLLQRFQDTPGEISENNQTSEISTNSEDLKTLFSFKGRSEVGTLSSSFFGNQPLQLGADDDPTSDQILLPERTRVLSRNTLKLEEGKVYLMRFRLRIEPEVNKAVISAGFSSIIPDPENAGKNKLLTNYFAHRGQLKKNTPKEGENSYLFSGLIEWKDIEEGLALNQTGGEIRPVIVVNTGAPDTKVWIENISVEEL